MVRSPSAKGNGGNVSVGATLSGRLIAKSSFHEEFPQPARRQTTGDSGALGGQLGSLKHSGTGGSDGLSSLGLRGSFALKKDRSAPSGLERAAGCLNAPAALPTSGPLAAFLQPPQQQQQTPPPASAGSETSALGVDVENPVDIGGTSPYLQLHYKVRNPKIPHPPPAAVRPGQVFEQKKPKKMASKQSPTETGAGHSPTSGHKSGRITRSSSIGTMCTVVSDLLSPMMSPSRGTTRFAIEEHDLMSSLPTSRCQSRGGDQSSPSRRRRSTVKVKKESPKMAFVCATQEIEEDPTIPHGWRNRAAIRMQLGDVDGVLEDLAAIKALNEMIEKDWILSADCRMKKNDFVGVIEDSSEALRTSFFRAKSWLMRGRAKLMLEDWEGANKDLSEGLRFDPTEARDWAFRALARLRIGDDGGAFYDSREAVRLDPRDWMGFFFRAEARNNRKDYDGAIKDCDKCIRLNPRLAAAYSHRSTAKVHLKDWDGVLEDATMCIKIDPSLSTAWGNRGEAKYNKGDLNGAISDCKEATRLNELYPRAVHHSGKSKLEKGWYSDAAADAKEAINHEPNYQEARDVLRIALSSQRIISAWHVPILEKLRAGEKITMKPEVCIPRDPQAGVEDDFEGSEVTGEELWQG